jgi:carboxypeptidase Q
MRTRLATLALFLTSLAPSFVAGQEPIDAAMVARIKAEGTERSQIPQLWHAMTDVLGARLTGSPAHHRAAEWARDRFTAWGLTASRLDPFPFPRSWSVEKVTLEMTSPRYMPLIGYPEAWTTSTAGMLSGRAVYVGDKTAPQIDALGASLRGAIVLTHLPQDTFFRRDRPQPAATEQSVRTGNPPGVQTRSTTPNNQLTSGLQRLGAGVILKPSTFEHGTVMVLGSQNTAENAVPSMVLAAEHYNMIARMLANGEPVEMRVEVRTRSATNEGGNTFNVIAEIPGTDPALRDEVVLIGAHLDSWHTGNGATDNGDGSVTAMEAMRILAAVGARPRRTIRVGLWGGEEQGLLGARAYLEKYLPDAASREKLAVYFNDDPGSGKTYGFYMENNAPAMAIFDQWLAPLRDQGVTRNVIEGIGSTDHVPFVQLGLPAFNTIKDFTGYDSRGRHTNQDFYERTALDDLKQSAIVLASFAWHAAQRNQRIPGRPVTP